MDGRLERARVGDGERVHGARDLPGLSHAQRRIRAQDRDLHAGRPDGFAGLRGVLPEVREEPSGVSDLSELFQLVLLLAGGGCVFDP